MPRWGSGFGPPGSALPCPARMCDIPQLGSKVTAPCPSSLRSPFSTLSHLLLCDLGLQSREQGDAASSLVNIYRCLAPFHVFNAHELTSSKPTQWACHSVTLSSPSLPTRKLMTLSTAERSRASLGPALLSLRFPAWGHPDSPSANLQTSLCPWPPSHQQLRQANL